MTPQHARTTANFLLAAAGLAAAYVIVTTPPLRRLALKAARRYLGVSLPAFLIAQTRRAWVESKRAA